jgi:hypothetical protein
MALARMALAMALAALGRSFVSGVHAPAAPMAWGPPGAFGEALMRSRLSLRGGKVRVTWGGKTLPSLHAPGKAHCVNAPRRKTLSL